jgi:hypothetical protein
MKLIVMLFFTTICFAQIKVNKKTVVYQKQTFKIVDKKILYKDTILYLDNGNSIRISNNLLYYYSHQVYLKFKFNRKYHKYFLIANTDELRKKIK